MARSKATTIEQDDAIARLVLFRGETSPKRVHGQLIHDGTITVREDGSYSVSEKTVSRRIEEFLKSPGPSPDWSLVGADPEEARLVLDVVADVFWSTSGRVWPSKAEAAEIARLRKAVPNIPSMWAYQMARAYLLCKEQGRDSRHLDFALGVRPWEDVLGADRIAQALGGPRSFRVTDARGPLYFEDSLDMLFALVRFQGSIDDIGSGIESASLSDPIPDPPDITVVSQSGRRLLADGTPEGAVFPVPGLESIAPTWPPKAEPGPGNG